MHTSLLPMKKRKKKLRILGGENNDVNSGFVACERRRPVGLVDYQWASCYCPIPKKLFLSLSGKCW